MAELITHSLLTTGMQEGILEKVCMKYTVLVTKETKAV